MECGHGGICYDCALEVWKSNGNCFICRNVKKKTSRILLFIIQRKLSIFSKWKINQNKDFKLLFQLQGCFKIPEP